LISAYERLDIWENGVNAVGELKNLDHAVNGVAMLKRKNLEHAATGLAMLKRKNLEHAATGLAMLKRKNLEHAATGLAMLKRNCDPRINHRGGVSLEMF
jgi:hypothetical protein